MNEANRATTVTWMTLTPPSRHRAVGRRPSSALGNGTSDPPKASITSVCWWNRWGSTCATWLPVCVTPTRLLLSPLQSLLLRPHEPEEVRRSLISEVVLPEHTGPSPRPDPWVGVLDETYAREVLGHQRLDLLVVGRPLVLVSGRLGLLEQLVHTGALVRHGVPHTRAPNE